MNADALSGWSHRLYAGAERVQRFNSARTHVVAAVGGLAGLCLSIMAGTFLMWAVFAVLALVVVFALRVASGNLRAVKPPHGVTLALAVFFNQFALVWPEFYVLTALGLLVAMLMPWLMRGTSWILWQLWPSTS